MYRIRRSPKEKFDKRVILEVVRQVESGVPRSVLRERYLVSKPTLQTWISRYSSPEWQAEKRRSFTKEHKNKVLDALARGMSVKEASVSFGINDISTICRWRRQKQLQDADLVAVLTPMAKEKKKVNNHNEQALADSLAQAELKIRALEMMIDLAEEQFNIDIRKKSGAKRSAK